MALLIFMTWTPKETSGQNGGWVGAPLLWLLYHISESLICVICGGWLDDNKKWNGIKENMEEEGSGVTGSPFSSQKSTI